MLVYDPTEDELPFEYPDVGEDIDLQPKHLFVDEYPEDVSDPEDISDPGDVHHSGLEAFSELELSRAQVKSLRVETPPSLAWSASDVQLQMSFKPSSKSKDRLSKFDVDRHQLT